MKMTPFEPGEVVLVDHRVLMVLNNAGSDVMYSWMFDVIPVPRWVPCLIVDIVDASNEYAVRVRFDLIISSGSGSVSAAAFVDFYPGDVMDRCSTIVPLDEEEVL